MMHWAPISFPPYVQIQASIIHVTDLSSSPESLCSRLAGPHAWWLALLLWSCLTSTIVIIVIIIIIIIIIPLILLIIIIITLLVLLIFISQLVKLLCNYCGCGWPISTATSLIKLLRWMGGPCSEPTECRTTVGFTAAVYTYPDADSEDALRVYVYFCINILHMSVYFIVQPVFFNDK